jgi:hypothetical protein
MSIDLVFSPEIRLSDGTIIRNREDAIAFARQHQMGQGRSESQQILRILESATRPEEIEAVARRFRSWVIRLKSVDTRGA